MAELVVLAPDGSENARHALDSLPDEAWLGRERSNPIVVPDPAASRRHARILRTERGYVLVDEGSDNGTWVRDARVRQHVLEDGDLVRIGATYLRFTSGSPAPPAATRVLEAHPPPVARPRRAPSRPPAAEPRRSGVGLLVALLLGGGAFVLALGAAAWFFFFRGRLPSSPADGPASPPSSTVPAPSPAVGGRLLALRGAAGAFDADAIGLLMPSDVAGPGDVTVRQVDGAPPPPAGLTLVTPVFEVTTARADRPLHVALAGSIASDLAAYVGLHDGVQWSLVPAGSSGDRLGAVVARTGRLALLSGPRLAAPPGDPARLAVLAPRLVGITVRGGAAAALLDLTPASLATEGGDWSRAVAVAALRVEGPKGRPVRLVVGSGLARPDAPGAEDGLPLAFDFARPTTVSALDAASSLPRQTVRFVPVFSDGREGAASEPVVIPIGVAELHVRLRQGWMARLEPAQSDTFDAATGDAPYLLVFDPVRELLAVPDAYGLVGEAAGRRFQALSGAAPPAASWVGVPETSRVARHLAHEWGHVAVHTIRGGVPCPAAASGQRVTWLEDASRAGAWCEGLATFVGQYGTERGVPAEAGAMMGRWLDFAAEPIGADEPGASWPRNRALDPTRVEAVAASTLSRLARRFGVPDVLDALKDAAPRDLVEMLAVLSAALDPDEKAALQQIALEEGLAWRVTGAVTDARAESRAIVGAAVQAEGPGGEPLGPPVTTDAAGRFELPVPPGEVVLRLTRQGCRQDAPWTVTVRTSDAPASAPQDVGSVRFYCEG